MKLAVLGASGRTGRLLLEQALAAGHDVSVLVRTPAKLSMPSPQLKVIQGDSLDALSVTRTLEGAEVVLSALGPIKGSPPNLMQLTNQNLVQALNALSQKRLIILTGAGVPDAHDQPKLVDKIFTTLLKLTAAQTLLDSQNGVQVVQNTDLDWTVVRAPRLTDAAMTATYKVGYVGKDSGTQISRADVAHFMLSQITDRKWLRKMPMISQ
jgi:putative NADH-flavin reductase